MSWDAPAAALPRTLSQPACVKVCPTGALTLLTEEDFKARQMEEQKKKAAEMMKKQLER